MSKSWNCRYRKGAGAAVLSLCLVWIGCGTSVSPTPASPSDPPKSTAAVFLKDAPADNVLAFDLTLTDAALLDSGGNRVALLSSSRTFEIRQLRLASTLAMPSTAAAPATYSSMDIGLASPRLTIAGANGVVQQLTGTTTPSVTLVTTRVMVPVNLSVAAGQAQALMLDFDLQNSLSVDSSGNYVVTPVLKSAVVAGSGGNAELSMALVKIVGVQAAPANSMDVEVPPGGNLLHVSIDGNTVFDPVLGQFSSLKAGQMIELEATFQPDGSYLAKFVDQGAPDPTLRFQGLLTNINQSGSSPVIQMVVTQ